MGFFDLFRSKDKGQAEMVGRAWAEILIKNETTRNGSLNEAQVRIKAFNTLSPISQRIIALELFYLKIVSIDYALYNTLGNTLERKKIMDAIRMYILHNLTTINSIVDIKYFDCDSVNLLKTLKNDGLLSTKNTLEQICFTDELSSRMSEYGQSIASVSTFEAICMSLGKQFIKSINVKSKCSGYSINDSFQKDIAMLGVANYLSIGEWITKSLDDVDII